MSVQHLLPISRIRALAALAALLLLGFPISTGMAQGNYYHVYFYSASTQPERFYLFLREACHRNWTNDEQGCMPWVLRTRRVDVPEYPAPGNKDLLAGTYFYALPICANRLVWKNNAIGHTSGPQRNIKVKLICR